MRDPQPRLLTKLLLLLWRKSANRLPLQFRVLYRQFLLRIVDFEALSGQADVVGFLGQFTGVLIMLSLIHAFVAFIYLVSPGTPADRLSFAWHAEQYLIATMMLVVGLIAVLTWDAIFPDRRDVMVLSPLPIPGHTILFAKIAASGTILGIAILALNIASGLAWPLVLGIQHGLAGIPQSFLAYWLTMIVASSLVFCFVLTVQGITALLLPRRLFLGLSALLQLATFALFLGGYFLQPAVTTPQAVAAFENQHLMAWSPSIWIFALFNQLNGTSHPAIVPLAWRAWIGLAVVAIGAAASLLLCYLRTLRKTVEEPDLVPKPGGSHWSPRFGSSIQTAIILFTIRALMRSRQHRLGVAFYLGIGFAIALFCMRFPGTQSNALNDALRPVSTRFLMATIVMMSFAIVGLRSAFSLPISLKANWALQVTQLRPSAKYIAACRRSLILLAVAPVWIASAIFSWFYEPLLQAAGHLAILALLGLILADLNLLGFHKIPFTCSYLPGKSNIQLSFWVYLLLFIPLTIQGAQFEQRALNHRIQYLCVVIALAFVSTALWALNHRLSKSAVLNFEETHPEEITTLRLG
jgi:hypothetical protein